MGIAGIKILSKLTAHHLTWALFCPNPQSLSAHVNLFQNKTPLCSMNKGACPLVYSVSMFVRRIPLLMAPQGGKHPCSAWPHGTLFQSQIVHNYPCISVSIRSKYFIPVILLSKLTVHHLPFVVIKKGSLSTAPSFSPFTFQYKVTE